MTSLFVFPGNATDGNGFQDWWTHSADRETRKREQETVQVTDEWEIYFIFQIILNEQK